MNYTGTCGKCGARRIDAQLGLEPTPDAYVATMVEVFRAVRRVMRDDATLWLNLGDSYGANTGAGFDTNRDGGHRKRAASLGSVNPFKHPTKPKDLVGIPWRLAFALQADGWWLRQDIIWHKPNPMPESCTDRCTKSHEYIFLLTKKARYYYDADAIKEAGSGVPWNSATFCADTDHAQQYRKLMATRGYGTHHDDVERTGRNRRSVWTIPTQGFKGAHFAVFPEKLVEPCVMAGTSQKGCCPECGAPWTRVVEKERVATRPGTNNVSDETGMAYRDEQRHVTETKTIGWRPGCKCACSVGGKLCMVALQPIPCTVLDPFSGAGTTGVTCKRLGRSFIGIELSEEYAEMARRRIENPDALPEVADVVGQATLFGADA